MPVIWSLDGRFTEFMTLRRGGLKKMGRWDDTSVLMVEDQSGLVVVWN
jgi:hypothetical protein